MSSVAGLLVLAAVLLTAVPASAADDLIDPDRPDLSVSARLVAPGFVQIESGVLYQKTSLAGVAPDRRLSIEASLRVGVLDWLELRLDGEPFVRLRGEDDDTGIGDFSIGAKIRLWKPPAGSPWPTLGILPFVKLPIAESPIGTERPDFGLTAIASLELPANFSLDLNARASAIGQTGPSGYLIQAFTSASLSYKLSSHVGGFTEFFFNTRDERDGGDEAGIHVGLTYLVNPNLALDCSVLTSLIGRAPDYAVRAGVSMRFGR